MNSSMINKNPTYLEMYNKIVGAYITNKLQPFDSCACFIGNMMNGENDWGYMRTFNDNFVVIDSYISFYHKTLASDCLLRNANNFYTWEEICYLEELFLNTISSNWYNLGDTERDKLLKDEDLIFKAMEVTLQALKQLHIEKGEVVDNPIFTKRQLIKETI